MHFYLQRRHFTFVIHHSYFANAFLHSSAHSAFDLVANKNYGVSLVVSPVFEVLYYWSTFKHARGCQNYAWFSFNDALPHAWVLNDCEVVALKRIYSFV